MSKILELIIVAVITAAFCAIIDTDEINANYIKLKEKRGVEYVVIKMMEEHEQVNEADAEVYGLHD